MRCPSCGFENSVGMPFCTEYGTRLQSSCPSCGFENTAQAKSLERRAVMSLARLWQSEGKKEEARTMLAEIYGWFTEGFDTKDLPEAKALLEQLT